MNVAHFIALSGWFGQKGKQKIAIKSHDGHVESLLSSALPKSNIAARSTIDDANVEGNQ